MKNSSMGVALFRVDGSHHLGIGHIMRCIAFAQGLEKTGVESVFVIRDYEQKTTGLIRSYGYHVETIPRDSSFIEDAVLTSEFVSRHSAGVIVTDLGNKDYMVNLDGYSNYLQALKAACRFLITIDGLCKIRFPSNIVIDPYYRKNNVNYESYGYTKFLLGPSYFILRKEFIEAAKVDRNIMKDAKNILVTQGGSDLCNVTVKIAKALVRPNMALNLRIVIGESFKASVVQELKGILEDFNGDYELIMGSNNMAELMLWSDLAIIGGGLTKYEVAATGTPSIAISQFDDEAEMTEIFEGYGSTLHLGLVSAIDDADMINAIEKLLKHYARRVEMSKKGKNLVDGKGIERIISEIPKEIFS